MNKIQSTVSSKNQVVIPSAIRKALKLKAGDILSWSIDKTSSLPKIIAEPQVIDWASYTRGLGEKTWQNVDIDNYINNLRNEWQAKT